MLIGKCNKFGNVDPGYAMIDIHTGNTIYKLEMGTGKAINFDRIESGRKAKFMKVDPQRDVMVISKKASEAIKEKILTIPGYRGLIL